MSTVERISLDVKLLVQGLAVDQTRNGFAASHGSGGSITGGLPKASSRSPWTYLSLSSPLFGIGRPGHGHTFRESLDDDSHLVAGIPDVIHTMDSL